MNVYVCSIDGKEKQTKESAHHVATILRKQTDKQSNAETENEKMKMLKRIQANNLPCKLHICMIYIYMNGTEHLYGCTTFSCCLISNVASAVQFKTIKILVRLNSIYVHCIAILYATSCALCKNRRKWKRNKFEYKEDAVTKFFSAFCFTWSLTQKKFYGRRLCALYHVYMLLHVWLVLYMLKR